MLEEASVSQATEEAAVLVLTSIKYEKASYKAKPQRSAKVKSLSELVGIEPPKSPNFSRPNKRKMSGMDMTLWENSAERAGQKGALLLLSARVGDREIFGIGFAPEGDMEGTKAILAALDTFKESATDQGDGGEGAEEDDGGKEKK
jgi:hypothetical protein